MKTTYSRSNRAHRFNPRSVAVCLTLLLLLPILSSCRKMSHNGKLDGFWQIQSIESIFSELQPVDPSSHRFICINLHVVNLDERGVQRTGNLHYDKEEGKVTMDFPYVNLTNDPNALAKWGIYENPVVCTIVKVDSKQLILQTPQTTITCRRF